MTKAEQKKAVQFTRMCKFWRANECKMGADCTFAHETAELRPSPKPCFEFSKTGSCKRGQACRFVHSVDNLMKPAEVTRVPTAMHQQTTRQLLIAGASIGPMSLAARYTKTQRHLLAPLLEPSRGSSPGLRPPPGLEDIGMMTGLGMPTRSLKASTDSRDAESRRSSLSEISFVLESAHVVFPKSDNAAGPEDMLATVHATTAMKNLPPTMCLSTAPPAVSLEGLQFGFELSPCSWFV